MSASADRTIQIRQLVSREVNGQDIMAMVPSRVITLKASPVSMTPSSNDKVSTFIVSLLDRTIATYDVESGKLINSFRATDSEGNDAVVMDALVMGKPGSSLGRPTILAGVSSTDKSVRIYESVTGAFVNREWGHTSAITDLALLETDDPEKTTLVSTGADGTIMIWDLVTKTSILQEAWEPIDPGDQSPAKEFTSTRPPLRRVLSKAELAEFQRASPLSTPNGRISPPRTLRKKTSKYSLAGQSPKLAMPPLPLVSALGYSSTALQDSDLRRGLSQTRSRSPPPSPKLRVSRRPSLAALDLHGRAKSTGNLSEFGSLNMATEQVCRTLRAFQKKLSTNETIRDSLLQELDQELRLTAKALGEKTLKTNAVSETVLASLLDQYSERLISIFDEKLRLSLSSNTGDVASAMNGALDSSGVNRQPRRLE